MPAPTPAQRRLLQALIDNDGEGPAVGLARVATVRACRANGWITRLPAGQYEIPNYAITAKGREAVERKARPAAERAKIAQDARSANARQRRLDAMARELRAERYGLVYSREEVEEMLASPIHKEGISAWWLRGYLRIPTPD